jgi:hypothetical protein
MQREWTGRMVEIAWNGSLNERENLKIAHIWLGIRSVKD